MPDVLFDFKKKNLLTFTHKINKPPEEEGTLLHHIYHMTSFITCAVPKVFLCSDFESHFEKIILISKTNQKKPAKHFDLLLP